MIPQNMILIRIHPLKFEIQGAPDIIPAYEPLVIFVDWSDNQGKWSKVTVQGFQDENGNPVNVLQTKSELTPSDSVNHVTFTATAPPGVRYYKYELKYTPNAGDELIVDPTLMVRRVGT
jgi:hypothetical protein